MASSSVKLIVTLVMVMFSMRSSSAHYLSTVFYCNSCPKVFSVVKQQIELAVSNEKRIGASLLRLHFHDCFVQGCDGSVLLDDTPTFRGEKTAIPNNNSLRGFEVIDKIKAEVEKVCPGVVSCADIVAIAARDSVVALGGPSWNVKVGRRDSRTASLSGANSGRLPPPTSTLQNLINRFAAVGLSVKDMVVLSGAHTIGQARCISFRNRIYNEANIDPSFARQRQGNCPPQAPNGDDRLAPEDLQTPTVFDINYFKNLIVKKGLLHSDQVLYNGGSTDSLVETYSRDTNTFYSDFVAAMIRMGDISPLTGTNGEIRKNCRRVN